MQPTELLIKKVDPPGRGSLMAGPGPWTSSRGSNDIRNPAVRVCVVLVVSGGIVSGVGGGGL